MVLVVLIMFIFSIIQFGWLLMEWNLVNNASREGCRHAIVNNTSSTVSSSVQSTVLYFMSGQNANFTTFTVSVSGTHNGVSTSVNNLVAGDLLTVTVTGQFPLLNIIPYMPSSITLTSACTMVCEGAM